MLSLRILHVCDFMGGGIGEAVPHLIAAQNKITGVDARLLITSKKSKEQKYNFPSFRIHNVNIVKQQLIEDIRPDIVVFHSLYSLQHVSISKLAIRANIPYVIVPHGGFSKVSQNKNNWKKKIANLLVFSSFVNKAAAIMYLTEGEKNMSAFQHKYSFVVPNGIDMPLLTERDASSELLSKKHLKVTYIGRVDFYYKGLDILLDAIYRARDVLASNKVKIDICGYGKEKAIERLCSAIDQLGISDFVYFKGPVYGADKENEYRETDIFILTSRSEGMPMVVLEALSYSIPCLVTTNTNMGDTLVSSRAGWSCELSPGSIANGLINAITDYKKNAYYYKKNAKDLAVKYCWEQSAKMSISVYEKVIGITCA